MQSTKRARIRRFDAKALGKRVFTKKLTIWTKRAVDIAGLSTVGESDEPTEKKIDQLGIIGIKYYDNARIRSFHSYDTTVHSGHTQTSCLLLMSS